MDELLKMTANTRTVRVDENELAAQPSVRRLPTTLAQISEDFYLIAEKLTDLDPDDVAGFSEIQTLIEQKAGEFEDKAAAVAILIREYEARVKIQKPEARRLTAMAESNERRARWLRDYLLTNMQAVPCLSVNRPFIKFGVADSPKALVITDEDALPEEFKTSSTVIEVNTRALKSALDRLGEDESIPGAHLKQGQHVWIR